MIGKRTTGGVRLAMVLCGAVAGITLAGSLAGSSSGLTQESDGRAVGREFVLRRAAHESLVNGRPLTVAGARAALGNSITPDWVLGMEARLAAVRFDATQALPKSAVEPPGSVAARLALLESDGGEQLFLELKAALGSPFGAVRFAALQRLARESALAPQQARETIRRLAGSGNSGGAETGLDLAEDPLAELCVSLGLGACLDYGVGTSTLLARFDELVALPIAWDDLERLRTAIVDPAKSQALADLFGLVLSVRLGEPVSLREESLESLCRAAAGEPFGDALESMSEEVRRILVLPGSVGRRAAFEEAGNALIAGAMELDPMGASPSPALLAGLRMIPASSAYGRAFDWGNELDGETGVEALAIADEDTAPVAPEVLAPFLANPVHPLFGDAYWIVGRRFAHGQEAALEPLLQGLLVAEDEDTRLHAFGWLASAGKDSDQRLRRAFDAAGMASESLTQLQRIYLRELDRGRPHPEFKDVILAELARPSAPDVSAMDLAAALRGDGAVQSSLKQRLLRESQAIVKGPSHGERLVHDGVASQLVQALGDQGLAEIDVALGGTMALLHPGGGTEGARPSLPKVAVKVLAASDPGLVARYLDVGAPRRVRVEAALQIANRSHDAALLKRASLALMGDFDSVDGSLRLASIRALCKVPREIEVEGLGEFALEAMGRRGTAVGIAALDLLAARGLLKPLEDAVAQVVTRAGAPGDEVEFELALAAARLLSSEPAGLQSAYSLLVAIEAQVFWAENEGGGVRDLGPDMEALLDLRGELLFGLVKAAPITPRGGTVANLVLGHVLRAPMGTARADLEGRFAGVKLLKADFRWKAELECFGILGSNQMSRGVLRLPAEWWRIDGRLLTALGAAAGRGSPSIAPGTGERLMRMGLFALEGERDSSDLPLRLCAGRLAYVALLRKAHRPHVARIGEGPEGKERRIRILREIARVEVDVAADLRSGAVRAGVLGAAYGRTLGIKSMGVPAGDPGGKPRVYARAGLRAAASMHEYLGAAGAEIGDPGAVQRAEEALASWERWRQLLGGSVR